MPWILQMAGFALMVLGIIFAIWVGIWVLLFLFGLTMLAIGWAHLREFLIAKGWMQPRVHVPFEASNDETQVTIVDADFTRVSETDTISSD